MKLRLYLARSFWDRIHPIPDSCNSWDSLPKSYEFYWCLMWSQCILVLIQHRTFCASGMLGLAIDLSGVTCPKKIDRMTANDSIQKIRSKSEGSVDMMCLTMFDPQKHTLKPSETNKSFHGADPLHPALQCIAS